MGETLQAIIRTLAYTLSEMVSGALDSAFSALPKVSLPIIVFEASVRSQRGRKEAPPLGQFI